MTATPQPPLHVKSYFARSVPEAIIYARRELGPDALLLDSKRSPPEAQHLGPLEVVFGGYCTTNPTPAPVAPRQAFPADGIEDLRREMKELRSLIARPAAVSASERADRVDVEDILADAGIPDLLAAEIGNAVAVRIATHAAAAASGSGRTREVDHETVLSETAEELGSRIEVMPEIGRVTALVGPPGVGKTTTLVKLAVTEGLAKGRAVRLISTDTHRIGGSEQLKTFAAILGVPFQAIDTTYALALAIKSAPPASLVLIDTAGLGPALLHDIGAELADFLTGRQDIDTHLVLTASMRRRDMENTAERFSIYSPSKLIFTKLDETNQLGDLFCEASRSKKPVSFFCHGQLIPEDIEPASKTRITGDLVRELPRISRAAA